MKPRVFIASSTEGLSVARAVESNLEYDAELTVWSQGTFRLSQYPIESLVEQLAKSDFGVFVFTADDAVTMRDEMQKAVRDNVIFELGLFIGRLGRGRCFIVKPRDVERLHIPTDLTGLTPATYESHRSDGNLKAALGPACNDIRDILKNLGPFAGEIAAFAVPENVLNAPEALALLTHLARSKDGHINYVPFDGGFGLVVDGVELFSSEDPKERAEWHAAFDSLVKTNILRDADGDGALFELTKKGRDLYDSLRIPETESDAHPLAKVERAMPKLFEEMRNDLKDSPFCRNLVLLKKGWIFNQGDSPWFRYYFEDHEHLAGMFDTLVNKGLMQNNSAPHTKRYIISEELVEYLTSRDM